MWARGFFLLFLNILVCYAHSVHTYRGTCTVYNVHAYRGTCTVYNVHTYRGIYMIPMQGLVIAGLADIARPAKNLSIKQSGALAATGREKHNTHTCIY